MDTLEDIIKQFENQTHCDNNLTLNGARQDTFVAEMKDNTTQ